MSLLGSEELPHRFGVSKRGFTLGTQESHHNAGGESAATATAASSLKAAAAVGSTGVGPTGITGHTHLISMIGSPVEHSASPATHSLAYKKVGIDAVFLVFDVGVEGLPAVMAAFREMGGWDSTTVTMPCKQAIIPFLDDMSEAARLMGAVNIVKKEADGRIVGYNSDGEGFMNNLIKQGVQVEGATMTLVGPGGAGSAVLVQAALDGVARLDVFARKDGTSYRHALELADKVQEATSCAVAVYPLEDREQLKASIAESDILANCTNVGMGDSTDTPVPAEFLQSHLAVADAIYMPPETQLLKDARAAGCRTFNGLGMLDQQAVAADRIRFGIEIPIDEIRAELNSAQ